MVVYYQIAGQKIGSHWVRYRLAQRLHTSLQTTSSPPMFIRSSANIYYDIAVNRHTLNDVRRQLGHVRWQQEGSAERPPNQRERSR
jgi:hypothetical protein